MSNRFGFTGKSDFFKELGVSLGKGVYIVSSAIGTISLSLGCAFVGSYVAKDEWGKFQDFFGFIKFLLYNPWVYIFVGVVLFCIGALGIYKDQSEMSNDNKALNVKLSELETNKTSFERSKLDEIQALKIKVDRSQEEAQLHSSKVSEIHSSLVESWLKGIAKSIDLDTHSRVSIYYEDDESFSILARYSQNPALSKMHKQRFALDQGVISHSWQHGQWYEGEAPHHTADEYDNYMINKYKYTQEELDAIKMKSCRYFGLAIVDVDDHIGVILFESTEKEHFNKEMQDNIISYCDKYQSHLCAFVRNGRNYDKASSRNHNKSQVNIDDIASLKEMLK
ncbi:hypothetical protein A0J47_010150 [Photobacterium damselae subsp. damselae]|uniref:hypothetical protein n=1 Tax=Photobacterium damselae TaxID=38293 RepID=UPI00083AA741|nr:hypothetical protein [Photobacterium damselae]QSH56296.1 hypothetical protein A0J47_010150 [Photobacterium damselae subsp. damselae]